MSTENRNEYDNRKHLLITRSGPLYGTCEISTSKNAILPLMAACLLTNETVTINRVPRISDVYDMAALLRSFGAEISEYDDTLRITARTIITTAPDETMTGRLRASFLFMGPLLAREGCVTMSLPGGCRIGTRPIDLHVRGFKALGAKAITTYGQVHTWGKDLTGAAIILDYPSVGATENIIMAACLARGVTTLIGAATEPEVNDLIKFLQKMGANIRAAEGRIIIKGVNSLHGTEYTPIPDRIEAGTLMLAAAVTGGEVYLERADATHLKPVCAKLIEAGAEIFPYEEGLRIRGGGARPIDIVSSPYPGFPTDMQAPFMAACCAADGISTINETVFDNRFLHVAELKKMGADITVKGSIAIVRGNGRLSGAEVSATDLRAGAALCIAALVAKEETVVKDIYHIDRGYEDFDGKLKKLGVNIQRLA
jgi:UDP-N-acetylglucosamine 1-carboxyvinyltransferase